MIRQIIKIDQDKCNGCGLCVDACHEGAIGLSDGKAMLLRDDYCDGLGNCLPVCPVQAISFEERDALEYNEAEVNRNMEHAHHQAGGCPGAAAKQIEREPVNTSAGATTRIPSQLGQWPAQIKLVPVNAPWFGGSDLLISADCAAYAYGSFHSDFMCGKKTLIGCPKLDDIDYSEKLAAILSSNDVKSITIARMEVPCCGGLEHAVKAALKSSGKQLPLEVSTISVDGNILA